jgi:glycosyltransferase involved in cell wall biosynthesis
MVSVSIAMATYNGERFIREQLESLAAQQQLPSELVVTDDGSADNTLEIVEQFAKATAPFAVHIHRNGSRLGYRANFMRAANLCTSDLIAFCDQDDIWSPRKLAVCTRAFEDPSVLMAYHNATVVTETGVPLGGLDVFASAPLTPPLASCALGLRSLGFTEVFRRSVLDLSDFWAISQDWLDPAQPMAHDQWVFFISSVFGHTAYIDEHLACYRQHSSNRYGWTRDLRGWTWPIRFLRNLQAARSNKAARLARLEEYAGGFAQVLEKAGPALSGAWHDRAALGSAKYGNLARLFETRRRIYAMRRFNERLSAVREIVSQRGYRPGWGVGRRALAFDLCVGVPMGHLL